MILLVIGDVIATRLFQYR